MYKFQVTWTLLDHDVTISVGNNLTHADVGKYEIDKPQIGKCDLCLVLSTVLVKVTTSFRCLLYEHIWHISIFTFSKQSFNEP